MSQEKIEIDAFTEGLKTSPFDKHVQYNMPPKLIEFEHNKNFVIRKAAPYMFEEGQYTTAQEMATKTKYLFDELREKYAIDAPVEFTVAKDENEQESFYILTHKVDTYDYDQLDDQEKEQARTGIKKIFESLITYYEDKSKGGSTFLQDLPDTEQYVYGSLDKNGVRQWYMIDTDPFFSDGKEGLIDVLDTLRDELDIVEDKFSVDLTSVRTKCEALLNQLASDAK